MSRTSLDFAGIVYKQFSRLSEGTESIARMKLDLAGRVDKQISEDQFEFDKLKLPEFLFTNAYYFRPSKTVDN